MKRIALFLLGALSALAITIALVRYPDEDPEIIVERDQNDND